MKNSSKSIDAFGQDLLGYYRGEEAVEIIERDDGYIDASIRGLKSYFSNYKNWSSIEKKAIKFASGRVLDVGCGAGRHSLFLQKKGLDVLGIDKSPLAIKVSKLRGVKWTRVLPFKRVGMLRPIRFDTILMLGHNFGLFGNFEKARRLLRVLHRITSPQAVIIATTRDPYKTDSPEHKDYHEWNQQRGRMMGQIRMRIRHGKLKGSWFDYLFVSRAELRQLISGTGWRIKRLINQKKEASYAMVLEKS